MGFLPMLEVNGTKVSQTLACIHLAAAISGIQPADPVEAAKVQEIVVTTVDLISAILTVDYGALSVEAKAEATTKLATSVRRGLNVLEACLQAQGHSSSSEDMCLFVGSEVTAADLSVLNFLDAMRLRGGPITDLSEWPLVQRNFEGIQAIPTIAEFLRVRLERGQASKF